MALCASVRLAEVTAPLVLNQGCGRRGMLTPLGTERTEDKIGERKMNSDSWMDKDWTDQQKTRRQTGK